VSKTTINHCAQQYALRVSLLLMMFLALPASASQEDPTRPPSANVVTQRPAVMKKTTTRWVLSSTLVSTGRRSAVINNRVVSRGDRINGAVVMDIQPARVRLRTRGREITLLMLKKKIKTPSRVSPRSSVQGH